MSLLTKTNLRTTFRQVVLVLWEGSAHTSSLSCFLAFSGRTPLIAIFMMEEQVRSRGTTRSPWRSYKTTKEDKTEEQERSLRWMRG